MTSFLSLSKNCSKFISLKSEINLILLIFFLSLLKILDFITGIFEKISGKKIHWFTFENIDVTLPDLISSKEVEFERS